MQSQQILLSNLPGMAWSIAAALLYAASTLSLGKLLVPQCRPGWVGLDVALRYSLGAAAFGLLFALLSMFRLAYPPVVVTLALLPAALALFRWLARPESPSGAPRFWRTRIEIPVAQGVAAAVVAVLVAFLMAYPLALSLAWVRGGDMAIYHLVVPRTVLWNNGLVFNPFSHDAGLYYGWQLYALPAWLMGGDSAFQLCSFVALSILMLSAYQVLGARYGMLAGLAGALVVVATACGMSRESVVNNDIPLALLQVSLLGLACAGAPGRAAAAALGLLGGFAVAVKLVAAPAAGLAFAILLWRTERSLRPGSASVLAIAALVALGPWPLFDYLSSGSPLPHLLLLWPPDSGYLPEYRESIGSLMQYFGEWYRKNFFRLFGKGLEFVPALVAGYLLLPFTRSARTDPLCLALAAGALLNALGLLALNGFDAALLFHDRYHLASYMLLALGGMLCWMHAARPALAALALPAAAVVPLLALLGVLHLYRTPSPSVQVNGGKQPDIIVAAPSLQQGLYAAAGRMAELPGGGSGGIGYDFAARMLPPQAVVATTVIDPYLLERPFLQMLPVSENLIDLSLPPDRIRQGLLAHGATHLHLSQHSGLNPWMVPIVDRSLASLRKVPDLPGVRRLLYLNYSTQKGTQGFYALAPADTAGTSDLPRLHDVRLAQEPDGTWVVNWQRAPGSDVRVALRNNRGQADLLGEAAGELGMFPIQMGLPATTVLEVDLVVGGQAVQTLALPVRAAQ